MTSNVGTIDRLIRAAIGIGLLYLAFMSAMPTFSDPVMKYGAAAIGIIMLLTAAIKLCPLYSLFGIRTCKVS